MRGCALILRTPDKQEQRCCGYLCRCLWGSSCFTLACRVFRLLHAVGSWGSELPVPVLGTRGQIWLRWGWQGGDVAAPLLATCRVAASRRLRTGRVRLPAVSWLRSLLLLLWPLWCSAKAPGCSREPVPRPQHVLGPRGACCNASGRARASPPQLVQDVRAGNQARMLQPSAEPHVVSQALRSCSGL